MAETAGRGGGKTLLLAGSGEARQVARALAEAGAEVLASIAEAPRDPRPLPVPTRKGGFGGADGFLKVLKDQGISRVLDATHPFAHRITDRSARLCAEAGVPYLQLLRPPWVAGPGDNWQKIGSEAEAANFVPPGATVFLATGRQGLEGFANLAGREVICRQIVSAPGQFPFAGGRFLVGHPPFSVAEEVALFQELGVDVLVIRNAGGTGAMAKLVAARQLGLPVLMLARPPRPDAPMVETVTEAVAWALG